jgi:nitroreductase
LLLILPIGVAISCNQRLARLKNISVFNNKIFIRIGINLPYTSALRQLTMKYPDLTHADFSNRQPEEAVDPRLVSRWSPRSFTKTKLSAEAVKALVDGARWAPSCFNEQPWRFYLSTEATFDHYLKLLVPANQLWAKNAALLGFVVCKKTFSQTGKPNRHAHFDSGAAWLALALQARFMGLYAHGMGGILYAEVADYLQLSEDYEVLCGLAIGVIADPDQLPAELATNERPSGRKALNEIVKSGL